MDPAFYEKQNREDFLTITLLDEGAILDPMQKLRQIYPNVLQLQRQIQNDLKKKQIYSNKREKN